MYDSCICLLFTYIFSGSNKNRGSIVHLEYSAPRDQKRSDLELQNLFLVGKGIVYDSGGHDLKVGGNMVTMHRDKCGAAAVAGFFKVLSLLKPSNINVSSTFTNSAETQISPPTISLMQTQG